jgi:hypothetical protein
VLHAVALGIIDPSMAGVSWPSNLRKITPARLGRHQHTDYCQHCSECHVDSHWYCRFVNLEKPDCDQWRNRSPENAAELVSDGGATVPDLSVKNFSEQGGGSARDQRVAQ